MESNKQLKSTWDQHALKRNFIPPTIDEIKKLEDFIIKYLIKQPRNKKILDAGCGVGQYVTVSRVLGFKSQGIDISEEAVSIARKRREKVTLGDIRKMPFKPKSFDIVIAGGSLEHFPETRKAISEISRVLRKSGVIIGNVPYKYALLYCLSRKLQQMLGLWEAGYEKTFSKKEFSRILQKEGLQAEIIKVTRIAKGKKIIFGGLLRFLDLPLYLIGLGGAHFYFIARKNENSLSISEYRRIS